MSMSEHKKRVLITTLFVNAFSGSELHTVAIAKSFMRCGYDVTIATFHFSYPLQLEIDRNQIHVINAFQDKLPYDHYDIFFAQHYVVAEYIIINNVFTFDKLSVSVLGPLEPLETLPLFAETEADLITFVSDETRDIHVSYSSNSILNRSFIFYNYAEDQWFNSYDEKREPQLQKLAIVSSHIPPELLDFIKLAESNGITVDCFGYKNIFTEISPEILVPYDVVISIGRTVQATMALGIPIYCYDHFGGPGYINILNFEINKRTNFAGRKINRRITGLDIYQEICDGFLAAFNERQLIYELAKDNFRLKNIFDSYLNCLFELPITRRSLENFFSEREKRRCYVTAKAFAENCLYKKGLSQIYFDTEAGYNELESKYFTVIYHALIKLKIDIPDNTRGVRFDPELSPCICKIMSVKNEMRQELKISTPQLTLPVSNGVMFLTEDPQYFIEINGSRKITIEYSIEQIDCHLINNQISYLENECHKLHHNNKILSTEINDLNIKYNTLNEDQITIIDTNRKLSLEISSIYSSKMWKLTHIMSKIINILTK
jgi:hypothetical protein